MKQFIIKKRNFTFQIGAILMLFSILFILPGCHFNKDRVKLASKNEILRYARQEFREAEYVSEITEDYLIQYTLKDKQYGFTYTVSSFVQHHGMDGSIFGYSEQKRSDFDDMYWGYIYTELSELIERNQEKLGIVLEFNQYSRKNYLGEVIINENTNLADAIEFTEELSNKIIQIDNRSYYRDSKIYLSYKDDFGSIGAYLFNESVFKSSEELNIDFYMSRAERLLRSDVEYQRMDTIKKSAVPGLSEFPVAHILGTDNYTKEDVLCYYFTANGKQYFITDIVIEDGPNNIRQHVYCLTNNCSFKKEK
jgi:hypothetical protein